MAEIDQDNVNKILDALIKKGATPATEATLEEVRDLFSGRKTGGLGTVVKDFATGTGSLKDRFKRLAGAITDVEDEGEFLRDSFEAIKITTRAAAGGMEGMTQGLYQLGDLAGGITGKLITALGMASEVIGANVTAFRNLSNVGANATLDLERLREASGRTGIDLDTLVGETVRLSKEFAQLTGSPATGVNRFFNILESFNQGDFRRDFQALGLTTCLLYTSPSPRDS